MTRNIETPRISEILWEEFMKPLGISAYQLAKELHVPVSRIQDILHDRRKITADTSIRLGRYFGVSDKLISGKPKISIRKNLIELKPYSTHKNKK